MPDHLDVAVLLVERGRDAVTDRFELVEHGGDAGIEQQHVADANRDLVGGLFDGDFFGGDFGGQRGADAL